MGGMLGQQSQASSNVNSPQYNPYEVNPGSDTASGFQFNPAAMQFGQNPIQALAQQFLQYHVNQALGTSQYDPYSQVGSSNRQTGRSSIGGMLLGSALKGLL